MTPTRNAYSSHGPLDQNRAVEQMTWARKPPLHHTHFVIDLIDYGLGVRNSGAIIFDEVLRRRNAALVHLDQALITIPQLLPPPDLLNRIPNRNLLNVLSRRPRNTLLHAGDALSRPFR